MFKISKATNFHIDFINKHYLTIIFILLANVANFCYGHGRLIEPPGRSTAWRVGFKTKINYNDHELFCGGMQRQQKNGGKCGVCGDPWDASEPRANEYGGIYGTGVIVRKYNPGAEIKLKIQLTVSHLG